MTWFTEAARTDVHQVNTPEREAFLKRLRDVLGIELVPGIVESARPGANTKIDLGEEADK